MKKIFFLAIIIIGFLSLNSCKEVEEAVDEWTQFTVEFDEMSPILIEDDIPFAITDVPFPIHDISTDNDETYAANNTAKHLLESAVLQNAYMKIIAPEGATFDFITSVKIYLDDEIIDHEVEDGGEIGLPKILISSNTEILSTDTEVTLHSEEEELVEYLKKETINYVVLISTSGPVEAGTGFDVLFHSEFLIDAKILGI